jgi:probable F420-dependent oxidoreductase
MVAMGVASVAALTGRRVDVALGTSSPVVVQQWHGRDRSGSPQLLRESANAVRLLLHGGRQAAGSSTAAAAGSPTASSGPGYRLRLPAPRSTVTVAAFGPAAIQVAAECADRMVINLVTPSCAADLAAQLQAAVATVGREAAVRLAAWVVAAVDPSAQALDTARRAVVGYLAAPGYAQMFTAAGFGDVVALARSGADPARVLAAVPAELVAAVGAVGDTATVRSRITAYRDAGVDEVVLVPVCSDADPAAERTLTALAPELDHVSRLPSSRER